MAKSKKRGPAQKSKSSYAQELQIKKQLGANIIADWTAQLCLDTMAIVLNDPEVMGHSALGSKRLMRVCEAFNELFDKTRLALSKSDEAEYWRVKIDQAQERIFGPDYLHWQERYGRSQAFTESLEEKQAACDKVIARYLASDRDTRTELQPSAALIRRLKQRKGFTNATRNNIRVYRSVAGYTIEMAGRNGAKAKSELIRLPGTK